MNYTYNVTYIFRSKKEKLVSIERVFQSIIPQVKNNGVNVNECYVPEFKISIYNILKNIFYIKRMCRNGIFHITGDVHYLALALPGKKTILTINDMVTLQNVNGLKKIIIKMLWYTIPIKKCKYITAISEKTANDILHYYPQIKNKLYIIPVPVDTHFIYRPKKFNHKMPRILQVGTRNNKNVERVIKSLEGILCIFVIIGKLTGEQETLLKNSNISFENYYDLSEDELISEYERSDIVIFASTYEGFGMPIVEAQALGRAVITSNIEPTKSVAGDASILVNPYDINDIRNGVNKLITDDILRERLIKIGLTNAKKYESSIIAKQYIEIYKKM